MVRQETNPGSLAGDNVVNNSPYITVPDTVFDEMESWGDSPPTNVSEEIRYALLDPNHEKRSVNEPVIVFDNPLQKLAKLYPTPNPQSFINNFMAESQFRERGDIWHLLAEKIPYVRYREGRPPQTYADTIRRTRENTGKEEAAIWGEAEIKGHKVIFFATDWDFMRGSVGETVATKYVEAAEEAARRGCDLVSVWASGGMRVDEGTVGLVGMERMQLALKEYREKTKGKKCSYISVLCGVFGGVSATVAQGDVTIGVKGTQFGFTGHNARRAFQGQSVDQTVQMIESHYINNRRVDYLVGSADEAYDWIGRYLNLAKNKKKNSDRTVSAFTQITDSAGIVRNRVRKNPGIYSILDAQEDEDISSYHQLKSVDEMDSFERYIDLLKNPRELDFEDFLRFGVEDVVPLYVNWQFHEEPSVLNVNMTHRPPIIAALGKIGDETFLFVGNQPSYYRSRYGGTTTKRTAIPGPEDCDYEIRILKRIGENLGVTAVRYADTFGALPTDIAERGNISEKLAEAANAAREYRGRSICIKQVDASGGGRPTGAWADARAARKHSHTYIAEPTSNLVINSSSAPSEAEVRTQIENMKDLGSAEQVELGIVQEIIDEPEGGASENTGGVIYEIDKYILRTSARLNKVSVGRHMNIRFESLRNTQILVKKVA